MAAAATCSLLGEKKECHNMFWIRYNFFQKCILILQAKVDFNFDHIAKTYEALIN